ncbi:hypothetical protein HPB47_006033 [Ixodes persulcatus]|uniref:Uncharacterized protein n=1 Tax=Ixodes persulcatus TaxID=34615 RepID=A0AC60PBB3_IXOPE|nr:hypothetical protein HPB47_006033 [Ixodes persulcatus]
MLQATPNAPVWPNAGMFSSSHRRHKRAAERGRSKRPPAVASKPQKRGRHTSRALSDCQHTRHTLVPGNFFLVTRRRRRRSSRAQRPERPDGVLRPRASLGCVRIVVGARWVHGGSTRPEGSERSARNEVTTPGTPNHGRLTRRPTEAPRGAPTAEVAQLRFSRPTRKGGPVNPGAAKVHTDPKREELRGESRLAPRFPVRFLALGPETKVPPKGRDALAAATAAQAAPSRAETARIRVAFTGS